MMDLEVALSPVHVRPALETHVSDSDIVPDEVQAELITWRDAFTTGGFMIGDIANEMIVRAASNKWAVTNDRIYRAVGKFCGKSGRTIRYYAETSAFYSVNIRNEYDVLPFSHFVYARTKGKEWESVLIFAAEHPEVSLSEVMAHFSYVAQFPQEQGQDGEVGEKMREYSQNYYPSPHGYMVANANAVGDLLTALDRFERALPALKIADPVVLSDITNDMLSLRKRARNLTKAIV